MRRGLLVVAALVNLNADCGGKGCPPMELPGPMTSSRAAQIAPGVTTGLAISTTHIFGDCRPLPKEAPGTTSSCDQTVNPACARDRAPLRIFVLDVNQSIPVDSACEGSLLVEDLLPRAAFDGTASEQGELVVELSEGHYTVYATADGRCAVCGFTQNDGSCRFEVVNGRITARDLILDEATH